VWLRVEVVYGEVEETLDLAGVQVHGNDMIATGHGKHICDELGGNRRTRPLLLVLPCIRITRDNRRYPACACGLAGRDEDEKFHHVVVDVGRTGLENENVFVPHALADFHVDLAVGKLFHDTGCERNVESALRSVIGRAASSGSKDTNRSAMAVANSGWLLPISNHQ